MEALYNDRKLRKWFGKQEGYNKNDLQALFDRKNEYHKKRRFYESMLNFTEKLLIKRRNRIREKRVYEMLKNTRPNLDYREKSLFIEQCIESDIHYFKAKGYDKPVGQGDTSLMQKNPYKIDFTELNKKLRKNKEILRKKA